MGASRKRKYAARLPTPLRKEQVLDAALVVLGREGLTKLSMASVAAGAGVGKPVLYTAFRSREALVAALLKREAQRALEQVVETMPSDLSAVGPSASYAITVSAFVGVVLDHPSRWRLILTKPDDVPREYARALAKGRGVLLENAEALAKMGIALEPRLGRLDPHLLAHTMMSFAEMVGRLALIDPVTYSRARLCEFVEALLVALQPADDSRPS